MLGGGEKRIWGEGGEAVEEDSMMGLGVLGWVAAFLLWWAVAVAT